MALGGNILSAMSDTESVAQGLRNIDLTVQISTKLNRSHLITGKQALILPCLGRTEIDPAGFVTVENSMGVVHSSTGKLQPASKSLFAANLPLSLELGKRALVIRHFLGQSMAVIMMKHEI